MKKKAVLSLLVFAFIAVIFSFSLHSNYGSHAESLDVRNFLRPFAHVLGIRDVKVGFLTRFYHYKDISDSELVVRKLAHFSEYSILGILAAVFSLTLTDKRKRRLCLFCIGPSVALIDEKIIQAYFSVGRTSSFLDVGIDTAGYFLGLLLALFCIHLFRRIRSAAA